MLDIINAMKKFCKDYPLTNAQLTKVNAIIYDLRHSREKAMAFVKVIKTDAAHIIDSEGENK